ncbi:MAG: glycerophosphodiester phosphodiesterase [Sulfobacillus sp.]
MGFYRKKPQPTVWGHRGLPTKWPENSLSGFDEARLEGADGIECDLRVTSDGEVIVMHDPLLSRTTGVKKAVGETAWSEISTLRLKGPDGSLSQERVPRVRDVLETVDAHCLINFELKGRTQDGHALIPALMHAIAQHHAEDRVLVSSFNPLLLRQLIVEHPEASTALLMDGLFPDMQALATQIGTNVLHINQESYDSKFINHLRTAGFQIGIYEIWRPQDLLEIRQADAWFLDDPGWSKML